MATEGFVYYMTNVSNTVIYIGVTSNLEARVWQHKNHVFEGFTAKYKCEKLVYFEHYNDINDAIRREKQMKRWRREWKNKQVALMNPEWKDLYLCPEVLEGTEAGEILKQVQDDGRGVQDDT